jgi:hypothetical protein
MYRLHDPLVLTPRILSSVAIVEMMSLKLLILLKMSLCYFVQSAPNECSMRVRPLHISPRTLPGGFRLHLKLEIALKFCTFLFFRHQSATGLVCMKLKQAFIIFLKHFCSKKQLLRCQPNTLNFVLHMFRRKEISRKSVCIHQ